MGFPSHWLSQLLSLLGLYTLYIPSQLQRHCLMTTLEHTQLAPASGSLQTLLFMSEPFFPLSGVHMVYHSGQGVEVKAHFLRGVFHDLFLYFWNPCSCHFTSLHKFFLFQYHLPPSNILPNKFCLLPISFH